VTDFHFKTSKAHGVQIDTRANRPPRAPKPPEEPRGLIQGIYPDSKEEWWTSLWLNKKRLGYKYQYQIGAVDHFYKIDFVVYTVPLWTMVEPLGNHWHTDTLGRDDRKRQEEIEYAMRDVAKIPMQFIWPPDMISRLTLEAALEKIFRET
jgi:hypothetical protein